MIKKIPINELQPGTRIERFDCSWLEHPFLFNRRKVKTPDEIERLKQWGVTHVYIKGRPEPDMPLPHREAQPRLPAGPEPEPPSPAGIPADPGEVKHVPVARELARAEKVQRRAQAVAKNILTAVRAGKEIRIREAETAVSELDTSIGSNKDALLLLMRLRKKDEYTFEHSVNVGVLLLAFCRALGLDRETTRTMGLGGLLHDVGKMAVPLDILNKPGALSGAEFRLIQQHVVKCRQILAATSELSLPIAQIATEHHERFDGSGYPLGLAGDTISRGGQMAAIADVFDALSADRCYHKGMEQPEVLRRLYGWSHTHFNEELVQHFIRCVGIYPPGTLVRLESNMLAVVVESGANLLRPVVRLVYDLNRDWAIAPRDLDLSRPGGNGADSIIGYEPAGRWGINPLKALGI